MNNNLAMDFKNPVVLRKLGIEALKKELGAVGMARFIRLFDAGDGDYTKERQQETDESTIEEISKMIEELRE
jgi:hypothetical protein